MSVRELDFEKFLKKREFANRDFYDATFVNYGDLPSEFVDSEKQLEEKVKAELSQIVDAAAIVLPPDIGEVQEFIEGAGSEFVDEGAAALVLTAVAPAQTISLDYGGGAYQTTFFDYGGGGDGDGGGGESGGEEGEGGGEEGGGE
jgi:hypothetical protein